MDAVLKAPCDVEIFRKNSLVMIHCLDLNARFEVSVKSFPVLQLKCIYGHTSFTTDLSERRVVVFPDSEVVLSKLKDFKSSFSLKAIPCQFPEGLCAGPQTVQEQHILYLSKCCVSFSLPTSLWPTIW